MIYRRSKAFLFFLIITNLLLNAQESSKFGLPHFIKAKQISLQTKNQQIQSMADSISRDNLMTEINGLQGFGTRYEYSTKIDQVAEYLLQKFQQLGLQTESDWFSYSTSNLSGLFMLNEKNGWIVGSKSCIMSTTDGGKTWVDSKSPEDVNYSGVFFLNAQTGWAAASEGVIIRTTNGGGTWISYATGTDNNLLDIAFTDENLGIAVGANGIISRTTDGGLNWTTITSNTSSNLKAVKFLDRNNLLAVGKTGVILFSTDAGQSWSTRASGTQAELNSLFFINSQTGWAAGNGPVLLKTTNGGVNWTTVQLQITTLKNLTDVFFQDDLNGWAIDYNGILVRTTNGGQNWTTLYTFVNIGWGPSLAKIKSGSSNNFMICGSKGAIFSSTDNGINWEDQVTNLPQKFIHKTRNIIGIIPGIVTPEKECVAIAHYDSYVTDPSDPLISAPGANDNGTGVSSILEAARIFKKYKFESTIKLVATSAEEIGILGGNHFAVDALKQKRNILAAVNVDMVGYPTTPDTTRLALTCYASNRTLLDSALIYNNRYTPKSNLRESIDPAAYSNGSCDMAPFAAAGFNTFDICEAEEITATIDPYYHKVTDTYDKINIGLVRRAAQIMLVTIAEFAKPIPEITVLYYINGYVKTSSGAGISSVALNLTGGKSASVQSGIDGSYKFENLDAGKSYTITPVKQGYTFAPMNKTFDNLSSNQSQDFTGTPPVVITYTISGTVKDNQAAPIKDAAVTISGGRTATIQTGTDGSYKFETLDAGKSYTITPVKQGYTFSPLNKTFDNLSSNQSQDFSGTPPVVITYTISGTVKDNQAAPIKDAAVTISGGRNATIQTGTDGSYKFETLDAGKSYTVTPTKQGYTFSPLNKTFDNLSSNITQDFIGTPPVVITYTISGLVKDNQSNSIKDVTVSLSGGKTGSVITGIDGGYKFETLEPAKSYTVTPVKQHYTFIPLNKTFDNLSGNQTQDFTGTTSVNAEEYKNIIPGEMTLYQNYPNPFNPNTTISFYIPNASYVKLQIYNPLGQVIVTLVEGYLKQGNHQIEFTADSKTSGIYYARIIVASEVKSITMNLIK